MDIGIICRSGGTTLRLGNNALTLSKLIGLCRHVKAKCEDANIFCSFPEIDSVIEFGILEINDKIYKSSSLISRNREQLSQLLSRFIVTKADENRGIPSSHYRFGNTLFSIYHDLRHVKSGDLINSIIANAQEKFDSIIVVTNDLHPLGSQEIEEFMTPLDQIFKVPSVIIDLYDRFKQSIADSLLVGVHMRKTDYRRWQGGRHFFEDDYYLRIAKHIREQFSELSPRISFISDEPLIHQEISELSFHRQLLESVNENLVLNKVHKDCVDLIQLSLCDLIVGPISTFSQLASDYRGICIANTEKPTRYTPNLMVLTGHLETDLNTINNLSFSSLSNAAAHHA